MKRWSIVLLPLLLMLCACAENDPTCASLIGGGRYCLQPTTDLAAFNVQQKVDIRFRERRETLIAEIEIDATSAHFVALTPFGHTLVQASYNNQVASAKTLPDNRISPALIMALLQVTLWPADSVRKGLETPLTLEESPGQRRIVKDDDTTLSIDYVGENPPYHRMHLSIPAADIDINIETLPAIGKTQ